MTDGEVIEMRIESGGQMGWDGHKSIYLGIRRGVDPSCKELALRNYISAVSRPWVASRSCVTVDLT